MIVPGIMEEVSFSSKTIKDLSISCGKRHSMAFIVFCLYRNIQKFKNDTDGEYVFCEKEIHKKYISKNCKVCDSK
jgi:hypothetical protein